MRDDDAIRRWYRQYLGMVPDLDSAQISAFMTLAGLAPPAGGVAVPPSVVTNATRPYSPRPLPHADLRAC